MTASDAPRVSRIWLEHRGNPEFLATAAPRIFWQVESGTRGWTQRAARLELRRSGVGAEGAASQEAIVESRQSQLVEWPFQPLGAFETAELRASVQGADGSWSDPPEPLPLRAGPLTFEQWDARLVASSTPEDDSRRTTRFRTTFDVTGEMIEATLSGAAHGAYEALAFRPPTADR